MRDAFSLSRPKRLLGAALVFAATFLCVPLLAADDSPAPSTGEVVTVATLPLNAERPQVERFLTYYPKEIYIGDPVYVVEYNRNASSEAVAQFPEPLSSGLSIGAVDATVACELCAEPYRFAFEQDSNSLTMRVTRVSPLLPGEKRLAAVGVFEFPPLEDWDAPFWKTLKEKFDANPTQNAICRFTLKVPHYTKDGAFERRPVELKLVVKPRPASGRPSETLWLDAWKKNTPETLFPKRRVKDRGDVKLPPFGRLRSHVSDVILGERLYDPWAFVRRGNRKPSDPNAPPVASEWRRLETRFAPSTLRDEIILTRLQLEYYEAEEGEASAAAQQTLTDWLAQRPEPQRVALSQSILEKKDFFFFTDLKEKNATLCDALTSAFPTAELQADADAAE